MNLSREIEAVVPQKGRLVIFWLGQAGFLLKDDAGRTLAIDPYLTDCGERLKNYTGFKRITPKLIDPEDLNPDLFIVTHTHFDHYDYDAVPVVAKNGKTLFIGPASCVEQLRKDGVPESQIVELNRGESMERFQIRVTATLADHGQMAPDAIGALVEMGTKRVYFSGDTAYHPEYVPLLVEMKPDVAVLSINGAFGNLTAEEGANFARSLGVKLVIPCHYWTFLEHGGDPMTFKRLLEEVPGCSPRLMGQGEMLMV